MTPARLIATFGGCGLSPRAPGTVGSFAALLVGLPLLKRPRTLACAAVAATVVVGGPQHGRAKGKTTAGL